MELTNISFNKIGDFEFGRSFVTQGDNLLNGKIPCAFLSINFHCSYQEALAKTEAAVVNILSSSSSFFTLVLSALFPSDSGDKLSLSKSFAVLFSICGVIIVCYSDLHIEGDASVPKGASKCLKPLVSLFHESIHGRYPPLGGG